MASRGTGSWEATRGLRVTACVLALGLASTSLTPRSTLAQDATDLGSAVSIPSGAKMLLEADTVTYDTDAQTVSATGGVRIDYGGYKLVARQVTYNQKTNRLIADGDVELQQPDGNKVYADHADLTEDFTDGFVQALRIETPANTRFAAAEAVRRNGDETTFERGLYTACEPCREHPERAPLWQVKARKIVWDQKEKEVRYYGAHFEVFGAPIAYMPYFQSPDPTVKRKSGFLMPQFRSSSKLGYGASVPYFWAVSDSSDLTVTGTYFSKQGFLGEAEWRQALSNGYYTFQAAGISQRSPDEFLDNTPDDRDGRWMVASRGEFELSDRWVFGWDLLKQSDQNFSRTYKVSNYSDVYHTSEVFLTGLGDRSYFDLRAQKFDVQSTTELDSDIQPEVLPSLDYERIEDDPILGGEAKARFNLTHLRRNDSYPAASLICEPSSFYNGACYGGAYREDIYRHTAMEGDYSRASGELSWQKTENVLGGVLVTPMLSVRGDFYSANMEIDDFSPTYQSGYSLDDSGARFMPTAALEARYPYLIETAHSSHVIEPIGQIILRPDETNIGLLPNEDSEGLVFNTGNLFQLDKFAGYDRIEGGTRANLGIHYLGTLDTGYTLDAMFGQSYHLAGQNSFAQRDLALVGYDSGLESDVSDYVASAAVSMPIGLSVGVQGRFDKDDFGLERTDVSANLNRSRFSVGVTYSDIAPQPIYGFPDDRQQITTTGRIALDENWSAFGEMSYDIANSTQISQAFGLGYANECFSLLATYRETEDRYAQDVNTRTLLFQVGLRTIADFGTSYDLGTEK
ncbi:LPS-assembly protein LptD [Consotaella salsifontis]|uniref:LPS-assembly protein LptD n=1 Tax=Consotaella salsifontis TaxID=1365950 RepID=A0A1T4SLQ3_9HYPH|nr:LPS-assembly protein LptD [Consotaella salsifontis]SKA28781.1 LPS-assembly protein [Consotaella salsifontis]